MVVVVTGGSGFIGSHVVDALLEEGHDVRVFDLVPPAQEKAKFIRGNLLSPDTVLTALEDAEVVYHLAAVADVNAAIVDPIKCIEINEIGTATILRACEAAEVESIVLASTTWVYGDAEGEVTENTPVSPPNHIYTKTKIGQEQLVHSWNRQTGLPYTILRYDIPYGPRMRENMAISAFVRRAMRKEPIQVFGDGSQGRCWVYSLDLASANVMAMKKEAKNQIFNVAGDEFVTISQITERLKEIFGSINVEHKPARPGDFRGVVTNTGKIKTILKWKPMTNFSDGLKEYVEWRRKQL